MREVTSFENVRLISVDAANGSASLSGLLQALIRFYQRYISYVLGSRCRFYPSCSHYAHDCLTKYPLQRAVPKLLGRILRCQPWHPGGIDLP